MQEYHGSSCCPARWVGDPEEALLCRLQEELQLLEAANGSAPATPGPLAPRECIYQGMSQQHQYSYRICEGLGKLDKLSLVKLYR